MNLFDMPRRLVGEAIGTALLLAAVIGSGIMGETLSAGNDAIALLGNTIATGNIAELIWGTTHVVYSRYSSPPSDYSVNALSENIFNG